MLTTLCGILVTLVAFVATSLVVLVGFGVALVAQVWTLAVQTFHAVAPMVTASYYWLVAAVA